MSAKEEDGEIRAHVVYNGSTCRISEIGFEHYPLSECDIGEGLPHALVDFPNSCEKLGWQAEKRVSRSGILRDRYLYIPKNCKAPKGGKRIDMIEMTTSLRTELQSLLPDFLIRAITCKAGNKICRSLSKENPFPAMVCDICCTGPIVGDYDGYNYVR
ncbi:uncharacterized protein LOC107030294 [Solanum pennellii]|uniref:Uncharacterized protein LOC107030294 n=1 Tax=Solanum pennellii TaxID=28526 RepID=A0ABM1HL61_SOLPN|nr:uncharacterized protein LOC107030294 [Solanum pennellii]